MALFRWIVVVTIFVASLSIFGGSTQVQSATSASEDCENAEQWLEDAWDMNARVRPVTRRLAAELQDGSPYDAEVFAAVAEDLKALIKIHMSNTPPPAANVFNELLVKNWTLWANVSEQFAMYETTGDSRYADEAATLLEQIGKTNDRLPTISEAFKIECGLADHPAFPSDPCRGVDATRWVNMTSVRYARFLDVADLALTRIEAGLPVYDQIDEMISIRDEQVRSEVPEGGDDFQSVVLDYFEVTISATIALMSGDEDELRRLAVEFVELDTRLAEEREAFLAPCDT